MRGLCRPSAGPGRCPAPRVEQTKARYHRGDSRRVLHGGLGTRPFAGENGRGVGTGHRVCGLRLLQSPQHGLRRGGVSIGLAQALLSSRVHGGGADERKRFLPSAGLCPRMPSARFKIAAAVGQRTGTSLCPARPAHPRSVDTNKRSHRAHGRRHRAGSRREAVRVFGRFFPPRRSGGGRIGSHDPRGRIR